MRRELNPVVHKYSVSALITGLSFLCLAEPLLLTLVAVRTSPWLERVREEGSALPALLTWLSLLEGPLAGRYAPGEGSFLAGDFHLWKPSPKHRTWRWKVVSGLLGGAAASSQLPAPCSALGTGLGLAGSPLTVRCCFRPSLQTTRLHLSFCIANVFSKQLDVSELDRSALRRI